MESAGGIDLSASVMRKAARENNDKLLSLHLPKNVNVDDVKSILPGADLEEMSSMGGGNVQGGMIGTGSKKGPWPGLNTAAFNKRQKKDAQLRGAKEFIGEEELVNEVVDYLLGITVG